MLLSEKATVLPLKSGMDCISKLVDNGITVLCLSWFHKKYQETNCVIIFSFIQYHTNSCKIF